MAYEGLFEIGDMAKFRGDPTGPWIDYVVKEKHKDENGKFLYTIVSAKNRFEKINEDSLSKPRDLRALDSEGFEIFQGDIVRTIEDVQVANREYAIPLNTKFEVMRVHDDSHIWITFYYKGNKSEESVPGRQVIIVSRKKKQTT